ncbi:Protein lifeguard 4 [Lemmus lemmus]
MADPDPRYPCSSIEDDFNYGSCVASASVHIRMAFLRKVYSILSLQVLLTTVTSAVFLCCEAVRTFIHERLLEALTVATVVTFYDVYLILQAFILTTAVFLGLTAYTLQSKRDFSKFGAGLFAVLWILCLAGFLKVFFHSEAMELVLASLGALLFCGFIIYDTHSLMYKLSPEEYVLAAISLYLDVINLFLHLLRFLEAVNKNGIHINVCVLLCQAMRASRQEKYPQRMERVQLNSFLYHIQEIPPAFSKHDFFCRRLPNP